MITKEKAKKLLSVSFYNRLTKKLHICYNVKSSRSRAKAYESLRDTLEPIFTYVEIFELHNDHLVEIAEVLQGLYPEADEIADYTFYILEYLRKQMKAISADADKAQKAYSYAKHAYDPDSGEVLNARYVAQTYQDGYYAGQHKAYSLLFQCLTGLVEYVERGK